MFENLTAHELDLLNDCSGSTQVAEGESAETMSQSSSLCLTSF